MADRFIADDPSEWLKENVDHFIQKASDTSEDVNLLQLMLDAVEKKFNQMNEVMFFFRKDVF